MAARTNRLVRFLNTWLGSVLYFVVAMAIVGVTADWGAYHLDGKSAIWGQNPRCSEFDIQGCKTWDAANPPLSARIAKWLSKAMWFATYAAMIIGAGIAVAVAGVSLWSVVFSEHREASLIVRLGYSRWLAEGLMCWGLMLTVLVFFGLLWVDWPLLAIIIGVLGIGLTMFGTPWAAGWLMDKADAQISERKTSE